MPNPQMYPGHTLVEAHSDLDALWGRFVGSAPSIADAPFNGRLDGSDDVLAVEAAAAYVSSLGGGVVRIPGIASVSRYPVLPSNVTLQGIGYSSGLKTLSATDGTVIYTAPGTSRITVQDMRIISANVGSHGDSDSSAVFVQGDHTVIRRCWISDAKLANVTVVGGVSDVLIEENELSGVNPNLSPDNGVDISFHTGGAAGPMARIVIRKNKCLSVNKLLGIQGDTATNGVDIFDCDIDDNYIFLTQVSPKAHGVTLYTSSTGKFWRHRIRNNRINSIAVSGIYILGLLANQAHNDHQILNNLIWDANHGGSDETIINAGIAIVGMTGGVAEGNEVIGVTNGGGDGRGIACSQSSHVLIAANMVSSGAGMHDAYLSDDNTDHITFLANKAVATGGAPGTGFTIRGTKPKAIGNTAKGFTYNFFAFGAISPHLDGNTGEEATSTDLFLDATTTGAVVGAHTSRLSLGYDVNDLSVGASVGQGTHFTTPVKVAGYFAKPTDSFIPVDTTAGDVPIILPTRPTVSMGKPLPGTKIIVFLDAAGGHTCTIQPDTGTINGVASLTLTVAHTKWVCEFDGTNYRAY